MTGEETRPTSAPLFCRGCGELIGVYEPVVHVVDATARTTSRAAEPEICRGHGHCYHQYCYDQLSTVTW